MAITPEQERCNRLLSLGGIAAPASLAVAAAFSSGQLMSPATRQALYLANRNHLSLAPSPDQLFQLWHSGFLSDSDLQCLAAVYGIPIAAPEVIRNLYATKGWQLDLAKQDPAASKNTWQSVLGQHGFFPTLFDTFQLVNRGWITEDVKRYWYQHLGINNQWLLQAIDQLRFQIPPPTDLIRFAVREQFTPDLAKSLGLLEEFPPDFRFWAERQGIGKVEVPDPADPNKLVTLDVPLMYWGSHWQLPSPTQGADMFFRVRPERYAGLREQLERDLLFAQNSGLIKPSDALAIINAFKPMTFADLSNLYRAQDYPITWRGRLLAINFRTIGRIDIRRLASEGIDPPEETLARYKDLGYNDKDANALTKLTLKQAAKTATAALVKTSKAKIEQGYKLGVISRKTASDLFMQHGLTDDQARLAVNNIDLDLGLDSAKALIAAVKRQFQQGFVNATDARDELIRNGIQPDKADIQLNIWRLQITGPRKLLTVGQLIDQLKRGLLTGREVFDRLLNLGYPQADANRFLDSASQDTLANVARERVKSAQTAEGRTRAVRQQQREVERVLRQARADLGKHGSPAMLIRWVKRGLLEPQQMYERLRLLTWPAADANRLTSEAIGREFTGVERPPLTQEERLKLATGFRVEGLEPIIGEVLRGGEETAGKTTEGSSPEVNPASGV